MAVNVFIYFLIDFNLMNEEYFNISGLLRPYIKNWRIYLPVGIVSLLFAVLFIIIYPPQYEINARIQLKEDTGGFSAGFQQFTSKGVIGGLLGAGLNAINVNNESLIISSIPRFAFQPNSFRASDASE